MLIEQYICLQLMRKNKKQRAKLCIRIYMQYSHSSGKQKNRKTPEMPVFECTSLTGHFNMGLSGTDSCLETVSSGH